MLNKIRVIHTAQQRMPCPGILNQMLWEQSAARRLHLNWDVKLYCPQGSVTEQDIIKVERNNVFSHKAGVVNRIRSRNCFLKGYYRWLKSIEDDYDVFLLRYNTCDPFQYWHVKHSKKPVYLVHHALEIPELAVSASQLGGFIRCQVENVIGKYTLRHAAGIIGVTQEILAYEEARAKKGSTAGYVYPNGVEFSEKERPDNRAEKIELLFVASFFSAWHGLDLLLRQLKNTNEAFVLHLVGDMLPDDYKLAQSDARVRLHGSMSQKEIAMLASHCHIGLSSFALERKGMVEACSLKIREYLMFGLPVYAGYKEVFDERFAFYKQNKCDFKLILQYAKAMKNISRSDVIAASVPYISKENLLLTLYNQLVVSPEIVASM